MSDNLEPVKVLETINKCTFCSECFPFVNIVSCYRLDYGRRPICTNCHFNKHPNCYLAKTVLDRDQWLCEVCKDKTGDIVCAICTTRTASGEPRVGTLFCNECSTSQHSLYQDHHKEHFYPVPSPQVSVPRVPISVPVLEATCKNIANLKINQPAGQQAESAKAAEATTKDQATQNPQGATLPTPKLKAVKGQLSSAVKVSCLNKPGLKTAKVYTYSVTKQPSQSASKSKGAKAKSGGKAPAPGHKHTGGKVVPYTTAIRLQGAGGSTPHAEQGQLAGCPKAGNSENPSPPSPFAGRPRAIVKPLTPPNANSLHGRPGEATPNNPQIGFSAGHGKTMIQSPPSNFAYPPRNTPVASSEVSAGHGNVGSQCPDPQSRDNAGEGPTKKRQALVRPRSANAKDKSSPPSQAAKRPSQPDPMGQSSLSESASCPGPQNVETLSSPPRKVARPRQRSSEDQSPPKQTAGRIRPRSADPCFRVSKMPHISSSLPGQSSASQLGGENPVSFPQQSRLGRPRKRALGDAVVTYTLHNQYGRPRIRSLDRGVLPSQIGSPRQQLADAEDASCKDSTEPDQSKGQE